MKRLMMALATLTTASAASGAATQRTAWFMATIDGKQWCAFTSEAKAKQAGESERFQDVAWIDYRSDGIVQLVVTTQSEDSSVEDSYVLDAQGRAIRVVRKGNYAENPTFSVTYAPGKTGKLELTPASRAVVKAQEKAQHETYFLDWPLYSGLARMPFGALIQTKPTIAITDRCIKAPR